MSPSDFRASLATLSLTGRGFARVLADLGGGDPPYRTVDRALAGTTPVPASYAAVLRLLGEGAGRDAVEREHAYAATARERPNAGTALARQRWDRERPDPLSDEWAAARG